VSPTKGIIDGVTEAVNGHCWWGVAYYIFFRYG